MLIREYRHSDLAALRAIHAAQGFDYALPDLRNPLFVTKLVLTDESNAAPDAVASPEPDPSDVSAASQFTNHNSRVTDHESRATSHQAPGTEIIGAAFLRLTAEAYLLLDPRLGTPRQRWQWLLALQAAAERDAWQRGLEDVHAWLPPPISKKFGKRLARLGWLRDDAWTPYCKRVATGN